MLHPQAALTPRVAMAVLFVAAIGFAAMAATSPFGVYDAAEKELMLAMRGEGPGPAWMLRLASEITTLGGWPLLTLFSILLSGLFISRGQWDFLIILLVVVVGETLIVDMLKDLFGRARPDFLEHYVHATSKSFPSGHSASAAAVYLTLGLMLANITSHRMMRRYVIGASLLLVFLIGASRVYLGVHYPSDVIAGWMIGAAWASAVWLVAWRVTKKTLDRE